MPVETEQIDTEALLSAAIPHIRLPKASIEEALTHTDVHRVALATCGFLTHFVPAEATDAAVKRRKNKAPSPRTSLLTLCLSAAFSAFAEAKAVDPDSAFSAFCQGLFLHLPRVAQWRAYSKKAAWDFCGGNLSDFIAVHGAVQVLPSDFVLHAPLQAGPVRRICTTRIITDPDDWTTLGFDLDRVISPSPIHLVTPPIHPCAAIAN